MYGWSLFTVIQTATISSLAYVFAESVNNIFYPFADLNIKAIAIGVIILFTCLISFGIKAVAGLSILILALVLTGIFIIVIFGMADSHSHLASALTLKTTPHRDFHISNLFTALLAAFW